MCSNIMSDEDKSLTGFCFPRQQEKFKNKTHLLNTKRCVSIFSLTEYNVAVAVQELPVRGESEHFKNTLQPVREDLENRVLADEPKVRE